MQVIRSFSLKLCTKIVFFISFEGKVDFFSFKMPPEMLEFLCVAGLEQVSFLMTCFFSVRKLERLFTRGGTH